MAEIAIVDKQPSGVNYAKYFDFEFDQFHLSSIKVTKLLKKDIDLDMSQLEPYKYVILVGSEAAKVIAKVTSVTENSGHLIDKRYIPLISPAMATFKPEAADALKQSIDRIKSILEGSYDVNTEGDWDAIQDEEKAWEYLTNILESDAKVVALDTETTALYPRDGYILGMSISHQLRKGAYIDSDVMSDRNLAVVQDIIDTKHIVMHNAKFDVKFMEYHYGLKFNRKTLHDTLILHYLLDETQGSHGLKTLALKYTKYGDYDKDLEEYKNFYCKQNGILKDEFNYSFIPFDIISKYAAIDTAVTLEIFEKFYPIVSGSFNLNRVYSEIMMPGLFMLIDIEEAGIPLAKDRLLFAQGMLESRITAAKKKLYSYEELQAFEKARGDIFNPNSVVQLRSLLFDYLNLTPTGKKTATGAISTDAEVLEELQNDHPIVSAILDIRKLTKIKNTYIDKLLPQIDRDGRIRTGFMMTSTTSGRLSSSGKFNAQQIVRDDPIVKGCIVARPGYKIVSQDLATAEMYYAATLSGDKALISVFDEGGDFHSAIAKMVFRLPCTVEEVKGLYKDKRQAAKAISFGILYGSGPQKVADTVGYSIEEAKDDIETYFRQFPRLKKWLDEKKEEIKKQGFIYSALGRKRRLKNVFSPDKALAGHEVRSGINFLIQSVASDVNLMAATEMNDYIRSTGMDARLFMLVHDSIVAEVREDQVAQYCNMLKTFTQKDRGVTGGAKVPIGVDQEIHQDYSFGKFDDVYGEAINEWRQAA